MSLQPIFNVITSYALAFGALRTEQAESVAGAEFVAMDVSQGTKLTEIVGLVWFGLVRCQRDPRPLWVINASGHAAKLNAFKLQGICFR
ncbi:MAG: hypothetical protein ACT4PG_08735 [Panacagrimonas sp.]